MPLYIMLWWYQYNLVSSIIFILCLDDILLWVSHLCFAYLQFFMSFDWFDVVSVLVLCKDVDLLASTLSFTLLYVPKHELKMKVLGFTLTIVLIIFYFMFYFSSILFFKWPLLCLHFTNYSNTICPTDDLASGMGHSPQVYLMHIDCVPCRD